MAQKAPSATLGQGSDAETKQTKDLFADCTSKQKKLEEISPKNLIQQVLKDYLFEHHPLFVGQFFGRHEHWVKRLAERYPYDFSIIRRREAKVSEPEWRYAQIKEYVKKLGEVELRLLLVARWLKQEGVCEPEEFLPKKVLHSLLTNYREKEKISMPRDLLYFRLVRIWLPYFERLLTKLRTVEKTNRGDKATLVMQGFDEMAVDAAFGRKSAVQAAVSWLAFYKGIDARTLENAYSRILSRTRKTAPTPHQRHNFLAPNSVK